MVSRPKKVNWQNPSGKTQIVFDDVLPAIKSAKAARMLAGGIYDKYSADQRTEIERIADIYLLDFRQAPIPHKEV